MILTTSLGVLRCITFSGRESVVDETCLPVKEPHVCFRQLRTWSASGPAEKGSGFEIVLAGAGYCALCTGFPKVISGLRKPIAIQAAISFNIILPE